MPGCASGRRIDHTTVTRYCPSHTCLDSYCQEPIFLGSSYCEQHACGVQGCKDTRYSCYQYCRHHVCKKSGCKKKRAGKSACLSHQCNEGTCDKVKSGTENSTFCEEHECQTRECQQKQRHGHWYCDEHLCTYRQRDHRRCSKPKERGSPRCFGHR